MKRLLLTMVCLLAVMTGASAQRLVIIHVNDTHSHLDPERSGEEAGLGGIIERAAYIDSVRNAVGKDKVLLLHAGDWDQGSPYYTIYGGDLEVSLLNALKYDCLTFGNHEFDNGVDDLGRRVKDIKCPVICANYDFSQFDMGRKGVKPYAVIRRGGLKIGLIGMLTDITKVVSYETASRVPRAGEDPEVVNRWADYLRNEKKCDMVIVLSHIGYEEDLEMVKDIRGVDIIIGGHSHTFVKDLEYRTDLDGKQVPVIQDGCWGLNMGQINVY
ncbi:MAG: metallophosphoesterase [Bacteroidales bacterium]|nr:metallophosphoesterase [Bacteroidales bacterium]MBR5073122.1 metallophosphoesterase [Bacteroidales bacterium]